MVHPEIVEKSFDDEDDDAASPKLNCGVVTTVPSEIKTVESKDSIERSVTGNTQTPRGTVKIYFPTFNVRHRFGSIEGHE